MKSEKYPLVTIGIPVRNGQNFLERVFCGISTSNYPKSQLEVVVCDHGSEDDSLQIIKRYQEKLNNIQVYNLPFKGTNRSQPRNVILNHASGEIIILIDQDIVIHQNFIKSHVSIHQEYRKCLVTGYTFGKKSLTEEEVNFQEGIDFSNIVQSYGEIKSRESLRDTRERIPEILAIDENGALPLSTDLLPFRLFWTNNLSFKKADLETIGLFDEKYCEWGVEDNDFSYRFQLQNYCMVFSKSAWCFHLFHNVNKANNEKYWRLNFEYFYSKFTTIEIELYLTFGFSFYMNINKEISYSFKKFISSDNLNLSKIIKDKYKIGYKTLIHSCPIDIIESHEITYLVPDKFLFEKYVSSHNVKVVNLCGVHLPYDDYEYSYTFICLNYLVLLDIYISTLILTELSRVARHVYILHDETINTQPHSFETRYLLSLINRIKFAHVEYIAI